MKWQVFTSTKLSEIVAFMNAQALVQATNFPTIFQDNNGSYTLVYFK